MFPEVKYFPLSIYLRELSNNSFKLNDIKIKSRLITHVDKFFKSIAYRVEAEGKIFVYSGDTGICQGIKTILKNADLAVIEACQLIGRDELNTHLSPRKAGQLGQEAGVKKLILTHLHDIDSPQKVIASCRKKFKGLVILAKDFLKIRI
ncbi:MAG: MBL fold metallo-hydrolase [Minisyncoccia bacterium]